MGLLSGANRVAEVRENVRWASLTLKEIWEAAASSVTVSDGVGSALVARMGGEFSLMERRKLYSGSSISACVAMLGGFDASVAWWCAIGLNGGRDVFVGRLKVKELACTQSSPGVLPCGPPATDPCHELLITIAIRSALAQLRQHSPNPMKL